MKTVSANTAQDFLGIVLNAAHKEPVTIVRNGVPVAVVVSPEDYRMLEALENAYLEQGENEFTPESINDFAANDGPMHAPPACRAGASPAPQQATDTGAVGGPQT